ncbi:Ig-like domain-containing protein [Candidatus Palauibacter sp.]|uniref:Ig-like domain-containing protein n=1 Tax=Candidatus Palauibacter sp. TaxID=3101350 RepID=UPI003B52261A
MTVTPATAELTALETTVAFAAEVRDQHGAVMPDASVSWSTSDALVGAVDGAGLATATGNGAAVVTATAGEAAGEATLIVMQVVAAVTVSPASSRLSPGDTVRLTAEASDGNGQPVEGARFVWSSSNDTVAVVDASGLVRAGSTGAATITAAVGDVRGIAQITVASDQGNDDRAALVALYEATDGPNWKRSEGWLTDAPLEDWEGVWATDGRVSHLALLDNNLKGYIPSEVGDLSELIELWLHFNDLTGPIPPELGKLSSLEGLDLNVNSLTGPIPLELGELSSLEMLGLGINDLTGSIPPELGKLSSLRELGLYNNELTGSIPPELGELSSLEVLGLGSNDLTGSIPLELGKLSSLRELGLYNNELTGSIPPELGHLAGLQTLRIGWLHLSGIIPPELGNLAELRVIELGPNRLGGPIPPELGNLTELKELQLQSSGVGGPLPAELGDLAKLEVLWLLGNPELTGPLPPTLTDLTALKRMSLSDTDLCVPPTTAFGLWLQGLDEVWADPCEIVEDKDRNILKEFYRWTNGEDWSNSENWLTDAPLDDWHGVTADTADVVSGLELGDNGLSGIVPLETGDLTHLRTLALGGNAGLGGELPERMLRLALLSTLRLEGTGLCLPGAKRFRDWLGRIGDAEVELCPDDHGNDAGGASVGEVGERFEGELESADDEDWFRLDIAGAGTLTLESEGEATLIGALYDDRNRLMGLDDEGSDMVIVNNVGPGSYYVQVWGRYANTRGAYAVKSSLEPRAPAVEAYLTQPIQSHDFAVPLVAEEEALLRVFVMADSGVVASMPPVRATFHRGETETHSVLIDGSSQPVPWEMAEGDLERTANAVVPARVIVPGTEMVVEVDPNGTLDPSLGIGGRIPAEGGMALDIRAMPPFNVTAVPFLWQEKPDSSGLKAVDGLTAEHEAFYETREWLPVADMNVSVREAVFVDYDPKENMDRVLDDLQLLYAADAASGYYMGVPPWIDGGVLGIAYVNSHLSVSRFEGHTVAHEFGHNLSLSHSPCGGPEGVDGRYPHTNGRIGAWGYDRLQGTLVDPDATDIMTYCRANDWISDYTYKKALHYRNPGTAAVVARSPQRTLVVRGGVEEGRLRIEPAFVLDAPPALPERAGPYRLVGSDDHGGELFRLRFAMNEVADTETPGAAGFLFAIPVGDDWAGALATIRLTGPEGSVALEAGDTSRPATTLVLDSASRRIVAILRESPEAQVAADGAGVLPPSTTPLVSSGIPSPLDWRP